MRLGLAGRGLVGSAAGTGRAAAWVLQRSWHERRPALRPPMPTSQPFPAPEALLAHQQFLRAIVRSLLHGADGADDVVQEVLVRAWQAAPERPLRVSAWLGRIARNLTFDHLRAARRTRRLLQQAPPPDAAPSAEEVLQQEEQR